MEHIRFACVQTEAGPGLFSAPRMSSMLLPAFLLPGILPHVTSSTLDLLYDRNAGHMQQASRLLGHPTYQYAPTGSPEDSKSRIDVVWGGISWRTGERNVGRGWMAERRSAREPGLSEHAARWTASMVMESGKPMRTLLLPARLKSLSAWLWRFHEGMEAGSQNAVTLRWNFWEMEKREFGSWKSRTARPYAPATPATSALPHPTGHLINGPDWTAGEEQPLAPRASWAATNFAPEGSLPTETGNARRYHTLAPRRTDSTSGIGERIIREAGQ